MKIAVYHDLPSGGAKRVVYEIVRRLASRHEIGIFSLTTADESFCDIRPFASHHRQFPFLPSTLFHSPLGRLNQWKRARDLIRLDSLGKEIAAEIDRHNYDAVWVHPCMWLQAPHLLRYLHTPSSFFVHEPMRWAWEKPVPRPYGDSQWRRRVNRVDPLNRHYRSVARRADRTNFCAATALLANSRFTADNAGEVYGRDCEPCRLGVDSELFRPTADGGKRELLSVGEIRPEKGFDFLIEAVSRIPSHERPPLRLVGNAQREQELDFLQTLACERQVELFVETNIDVRTLVRRYNEAAVLAYAPVREPFGLVALEAAACGAAAVGVAEGGVGETIVDEVTGLLTPRDPGRFAAAIQRVLRDEDLRIRLGRAARRAVVADWTWDQTAQKVEDSLRRLVSASAAA